MAQDQSSEAYAAQLQEQIARQSAAMFKPEDLQAGRADIGKVVGILEGKGIDPSTVSTNSSEVEKALRDADYAAQAGQPLQQKLVGVQEDDRLAQLQAQLDEVTRERDDYSKKFEAAVKSSAPSRAAGRRLRELEQQVRDMRSHPVNNFQGIPGPQVAGLDPNQPITAGDLWGLMMAQSQALGNRVDSALKQVVGTARALNGYSLTPDQEDDLLDAHPWLDRLPTGEREQAMMDLSREPQKSRPPGPPPGTRLTPNAPSQEEILRQRVRQAAFIPAPNQASPAEQRQGGSANAARAELIKKYNEALQRPGGSIEAERILAQLGYPRVDDQNRQFSSMEGGVIR